MDTMRVTPPYFYFLAVILATVLSVSSSPALTLPSIFGDHMVLQGGKAISIWGTADPHYQVKVTLGDSVVITTSDPTGYWHARITPPNTRGPFDLAVEAEGEKIHFQDVLIGDVWFCSGQSNMERTVMDATDPEEILDRSDQPTIRLFRVQPNLSADPATDLEGEWLVSNRDSVKDFSAIGYLFGHDLHSRFNRPIGLIEADWSSRGAESFMSYEILASDPILRPVLMGTDKVLSERKRAVDLGENPPNLPASRATFIYNGMIAPLMPFGLSGVIWYQGESNTWRAAQYRKMLPTLIDSWREGFLNPDLPFLVVQLANWDAEEPEIGVSNVAELRDAQMSVLDLPHTAVIVTADLGEGDIHPKGREGIPFRRVVAERLVNAAASIVYGEDIAYSGPRYRSMNRDGSALRIRFDTQGRSLEVLGSDLTGFLIAGEDRVFTIAGAHLEGDAVIIRSPIVPDPAAVRYGWSANPVLSLTDSEGFPAYPFRTDDWPLTTKGRFEVDPDDPAN